MKSRLIFLLVILLSVVEVGRCERIKDIVDIQGVRSNPLLGIGLVVGLAGTGDNSLPSRQILTNIFRQYGSVYSPTDLTGGNVAVVMVTAQLGPFAHKDSKIDVDVASIGDAKTLQGGMLLVTELKGLDGQVYAVAQGALFIGGWSAAGDKASIVKNHPTIGRIPGGAVVEKEEIATFVEHIGEEMFVTLNLRNNDFATAERIRKAINEIHPGSAVVADAGTIAVKIPARIGQGGIVGFIDEITRPDVEVDVPAVVVINERTGTIVVGQNVGISEVAVSQGSLVVKIKETEMVSQPTAPFSSGGTTEKVPDTMIGVEEKDGYLVPVPKVVTVSDLAKALNAIGATPGDLIAIFNALRAAGALQARLEIM